MKRWIICLLGLLVLMTAVCPALAKNSSEWDYSGEMRKGNGVWPVLLFSDDDNLQDGMTYEPVLLLGQNDEMEAWLVRTGLESEDGTVQSAGYLTMYIQLSPEPKILSAIPAGEPLEKKTPTCEVRFLLDSAKLLDEEQKLAPEYRELFKTGEEYKTITDLYLDTQDSVFLQAGWTNRIRVQDGKAKYTLTYKKSYPVTDEKSTAALATARAEGFSLYDPQFPAEFEWGYANMTLGFSADCDIKAEKAPDLSQLSRDEAVGMITGNMPQEEREIMSADRLNAMIDKMEIVGPIQMLRYTGTLGKQTVYIEILPVPEGEKTRYIVEICAECKSLKKAAGARKSILEELDGLGIVQHQDSMKTQMILNGTAAARPEAQVNAQPEGAEGAQTADGTP